MMISYHFDGGTFSMNSNRSVFSVSFRTEFMLGHTHLHLLSSYESACFHFKTRKKIIQKQFNQMITKKNC